MYGYHLQLDEEIPSEMKTEIVQFTRFAPPFVCFNVASDSSSDCIEEVWRTELDARTKKPQDEVRIFSFLRRLFIISQPNDATLILVRGAQSGWSPLRRQSVTLEQLISAVYEYLDRYNYDVYGVYDIVEKTQSDVNRYRSTEDWIDKALRPPEVT